MGDLQKTKAANDLTLSNFFFHYWATDLRCLKFWSHFHDQPDRPDWVAMVLHTEYDVSVAALVGSSLPIPSIPSLNSVVTYYLWIWAQFWKVA